MPHGNIQWMFTSFQNRLYPALYYSDGITTADQYYFRFESVSKVRSRTREPKALKAEYDEAYNKKKQT